MGETYQPKGGMCATCIHRARDCSALPFREFPVIKRAGLVVVVRCAEYARRDGA